MDRITSASLDYTKKEVWCDDKGMGEIATNLGYVLNDRFRTVFLDFVVGTVVDATMTDFLLLVAQHYFSKVTPPLTKINGRHN